MKVLFVCTGNTCRSPMAEWILQDMVDKKGLDIEVKSAGVFAMKGNSMAENAIMVLEELDIEVDSSSSTPLTEDIILESDLILTMSKSHRDNILYLYPDTEDKIFLLNEYSYGKFKDIEDPFGGNLERYRIARDEIYKAIENIVNIKEDFR